MKSIAEVRVCCADWEERRAGPLTAPAHLLGTRTAPQIGLQEPIDVLEVDGQIYGFSGCHRYEAHVNLGLPTILCRVRKASPQTLKMHMM